VRPKKEHDGLHFHALTVATLAIFLQNCLSVFIHEFLPDYFNVESCLLVRSIDILSNFKKNSNTPHPSSPPPKKKEAGLILSHMVTKLLKEDQPDIRKNVAFRRKFLCMRDKELNENVRVS
jgi:hypothetical protein